MHPQEPGKIARGPETRKSPPSATSGPTGHRVRTFILQKAIPLALRGSILTQPLLHFSNTPRRPGRRRRNAAQPARAPSLRFAPNRSRYVMWACVPCVSPVAPLPGNTSAVSVS